eukprot:gene2328-2636_t
MSKSDHPKELYIDEKWDKFIDISLRRVEVLALEQPVSPLEQDLGRGLLGRKTTRPRSVCVAARLNVERFAGTNVYYLLLKSKKGFSEGNQVVLRTLDQVKE